ncbi:MAG: MoxR family ATPase [Candidatus Margulisbacteria bacterium]|nr:MoxR family ATPase [Candidatus Margulisiibacteriota bacterium]
MVNIEELNKKIEQETILLTKIKEEIKKVIIGQEDMIERIIIALISGGHVLLEGVPGLAKTLTIKTIARVISGTYKRIQFTPDLLPADIIGTMIYNQKTTEFFTKKGPVFANIILADEINRSPAKVQSALLEAMQEKQVTISDDSYTLPNPFMVLATQNPIEQEGTYPLPEAQVDRFMLKIKVTYPSKKEEKDILDLMETNFESQVNSILTLQDILRLQQITREVYIDPKLKSYIVDIVFATREPENYGLAKVKNLIDFGASPRASIYLMQAAKAMALMQQRGYVIPDDIKIIAKDVLRHRVILSYEAEAEQVVVENLIDDVIREIEVP